jgi:hypothetical protein
MAQNRRIAKKNQSFKEDTKQRGRIPIFGRTKVQGIIDHFPPASPSSHANLSAKAWRRRKPCGGGLPIWVFFHFWLD